MVSTQTANDAATEAPATGSLLVSLTSLPHEALEATLSNLALAFPNQTIFVAMPNAAPSISSGTSRGALSARRTASGDRLAARCDACHSGAAAAVPSGSVAPSVL